MPIIPTELYICVPTRLGCGTSLRTNIWANLTRKDTGEGIGGKSLHSYLDGVHISELYTAKKTGYAGPFDIRAIQGLHKTWIEFQGDVEFEPCKSEEITLVCDPNLASTRLTMQMAPTSGYAPLTIKATGFIEERYVENGVPKGRPPAYSLPLDLMLIDTTSTRRMQPVKTVMSNADGTYAIEYTFTKPGTYAIFVNFLGDEKYISAWSNKGQTSTITVTGGGLPLSFEKSITVTTKETIQFKWILSATEPQAPTGYARFPDLDLDFGLLGKYWAFIKTD